MKLIATDLDGTLLNEHHQISPENLAAIRKAQSQGILVVVATGRSYEAAQKPLQDAGLVCPVICMNGARTYTSISEIIRSVPLNSDVCEKIQAECEKDGLYFEVYTNEGIYSKDRESFIRVMMDIMRSANPELESAEIKEFAEKRFQDEQFRFTENFDTLFTNDQIEVYKILAFSYSKEKTDRINQRLANESDLIITSSGFDNLEFNHPYAQKGLALEQFANLHSIEMKDVMALGDSYNDLSMLKMVGHSVAMGNADEAIKAACNFVTKSNRENGVAYAIEEILQQLTKE
ncbi:Cof-type HAD-IIB family hydrolase [Aquibacillus kalidii]|uniref:Cof-type HAD-IIB family hydrolase n=1 Tax=Aquibacillus kalidii TaxID=2762597 RepID=UPI0016452F16|nr:Cof-type HAD-IIB family hydrolase [Aquibacillus kalidii]